jgi:tripartite-type tricarboxylate transporter receptor subunit TctC
MRMPLVLHVFFAALTLAMARGIAIADQEYPNRPITVVVPFSAGGAVDLIARVLGQHASRTLGQPIVVENVTGAGGTIAATRVARAVPDGYTILVGNLGTQVASVGNYKNLPYEPRRDFAPVTLVANSPEVLLINKDLPCQTLQEFIAYSKSNGRSLTFGTAGVGSISHLAYLLFSHLSKTNFVMVPYAGDPQADTDLIGGRLSAAFNQAVLAATYVKSGKVGALVAASLDRSAVLPDVPSSVEAGMPDLQVNAWTAFFVPKATPQPIVGRLNAAFQKALADVAVVQRFSSLGVDVPSPKQRTPSALDDLIDFEFNKWLPLIQSASSANNQR